MRSTRGVSEGNYGPLNTTDEPLYKLFYVTRPHIDVSGIFSRGCFNIASPALKKKGGGTPTPCFSSSKFDGHFSRHGVGVSSYITNLSDKQATTKNRI